jgi:hypothetical protein
MGSRLARVAIVVGVTVLCAGGLASADPAPVT